jgi:predicted nucleic acid-binding protein
MAAQGEREVATTTHADGVIDSNILIDAMRELQRFFQRCTLLPVTATVSQIAFQLMESFYLSHGLILPDALIAATALEHNLTLYTRNTRHFRMIPRLKVSQPY